MKTLFAAIIFIASASHAYAFSSVYLMGKGVGGEMSCSDWNRAKISHAEKAAMMQWVFGFTSGYDTAVRPDPADDTLNAPPIVNLIERLCKEHPEGDLVKVAKSIAEYLEKEATGEVSPAIILNKSAETDPDSCEGKVVSADGKVTVGKCWTNNAEAQKLIAGACGEGDKCEVHGEFTRAGEIKRFGFATGPKGISFKMKPCPSCTEGLEKILKGEQK
jgi:hypothetical protein